MGAIIGYFAVKTSYPGLFPSYQYPPPPHTTSTRSLIYKYAHTGDVQSLKNLNHSGQSLDALDAKGNSPLCEAVWRQDKTAVTALVQAGANSNHACMQKIPESYKTAAGLKAATTVSATGLSTGAVVGIGVGAAALIGGGVALAAGGGGGGSHKDACEGIVCDGENQHCSAGACVCNAGFTMFDGVCYETLACVNGAQNANVCVCQPGYAGALCDTCDTGYINQNGVCYVELTCGANQHQEANACVCDTGYGFYGTAECHPTLACKDGTQQGDICICNGHASGALCDTCEAGYGFHGTNACHADLACINGAQTADACVCSTQGWTGLLCDTPASCDGYDYETCPTGYAPSATCLSGETTKLQCNTCAEGYGKYGSDTCHLTLSCGDNQHQQGDTCVCNPGYELQGGVCTLVATCTTSQYWNGTQCVACPSNSTSAGGAATSCTCNSGYVMVENVCLLQTSLFGYIFKNGVDLNTTAYINNQDISITTDDLTEDAELKFFHLESDDNAFSHPVLINNNQIQITGTSGNINSNAVYGIHAFNGSVVNNGNIKLQDIGFYTSGIHIELGDDENTRQFYLTNNGLIQTTSADGLNISIDSADVITGISAKNTLSESDIANAQSRLSVLNAENATVNVEDGTGVLLEGSSFVNNGTITVGKGVGVSAELTTATNNGTITSGYGDAIKLKNSTFNNGLNGVINATAGVGIEESYDSNASTIRNEGKINVENNALGLVVGGTTYSYTVDGISSSLSSLTNIYNSGIINVNSILPVDTGYAFISGITGYQITNDGTITLVSSGANVRLTGIRGNSDVVSINNGTINLTDTGNSGESSGDSQIVGLFNGKNNGDIVINTAAYNSINNSENYNEKIKGIIGQNNGSIVITEVSSENATSGGNTVVGVIGDQTSLGNIVITATHPGSVVGLRDTGLGNRGVIEINSNSLSSMTGYQPYLLSNSHLFNNYGSIILNLSRPANLSDGVGAGAIGMEGGNNNELGVIGTTSTVNVLKNYGTIQLTSSNSSEYSGVFNTLYGYYSNDIIDINDRFDFQNSGDIILTKHMPNDQDAIGVSLGKVSNRNFYNGFKDDAHTQQAKIEIISTGKGDVTGVSGGTTIINDGKILLQKELTDSYDAVIAINGGQNITNNGTISVNNNNVYGKSTGIYASQINNTGNILVESLGYARGIEAATPSGLITNSGNITVNSTGGEDAIGILVGFLGDVTVVNTGTITVNATNANNTSVEAGNAYGIYASGPGTKVYNTGTIKVNGDSRVGSDAADACDKGTCYYVNSAANNAYKELATYINGMISDPTNDYPKVTASAAGFYATRTGSGTTDDPYILSDFVATTLEDSTVSHIFLDDDATFVDGGYTAMGAVAANFNALTNGNNGNYAVTTGFSMQTSSASGLLQVDPSAVTGSNATEFTLVNAFESPDVNDLELKSNSYMFDADLVSTSDTTHDIVMTMKSFDELTDNKSLAAFLANNYAGQKNEAFFNELKSIGSAEAFTSALTHLTAGETLTRFTHEDLTALRDVNANMNALMFSNMDQPLFQNAGTFNAFSFQNDRQSSAQFALAHKRISPYTKIGYAMSTTHLNSDNRRSTTRQNDIFQAFTPIGYDRFGWQLISTPQIGFARAHYSRKGYNGTSYDGIIEKRIAALMNEARYPIQIGSVTLAPTVEFNALFYNQKGNETKKAYSLTMPSDNTLSVEAGAGFHLETKVKGFSLTAGAMLYRELADPYNMKVGMNGMDGSFDLFDEQKKYRGVTDLGFGYDVGPFNVYGNLRHFVETQNRTQMKAGFNIHF